MKEIESIFLVENTYMEFLSKRITVEYVENTSIQGSL